MIKDEELKKEWDCLLLVYADLTWIGKYVAKNRMNEIRFILKNKR